MRSIEERLVRDIAAVTGGIVMTESNLRDAREAVNDRIESRRQRNRRRALVATAAVLVPAVGVAAFQLFSGDEKTTPSPAQPGPTGASAEDVDADFLAGDDPTPELINGVWRVDNDVALLVFDEDGTVRVDRNGAPFSHPAFSGTYEIDGDVITVTTTGGQPECIGEELPLRASLPEAGFMRMTQSSFGACSPMLVDPRWELEQVLPMGSTLRGLQLSAKGDWQPPAGLPSLYGTWMAVGGGHVLELAVDGYVVAGEDGAVVDQGSWTLDRSSAQLSFVSGAGSSTCEAGDRLVLAGVEHEGSNDATGMRSTVAQNTCGGAWADEKWLLFPHQDS